MEIIPSYQTRKSDLKQNTFNSYMSKANIVYILFTLDSSWAARQRAREAVRGRWPAKPPAKSPQPHRHSTTSHRRHLCHRPRSPVRPVAAQPAPGRSGLAGSDTPLRHRSWPPRVAGAGGATRI